MKRLLTTSWDDGHPSDFRLAELLEKYNLAATFYIPKRNPEQVVMTENKIILLAKGFEIGGHTLNHVRLSSKSESFLDSEIKGCFNWLKQLLGKNPTSFCFPGGVVRTAAINSAYQAGFKILRTTELLSTATRSFNNLLPTTVQAFDHTQSDYIKNILKRMQYKNLLSWIFHTKCSADTLYIVDQYLKEVLLNGGCFHLWGHSWEIEQYNLWGMLEIIFKRISNISEITYLENKDVI